MSGDNGDGGPQVPDYAGKGSGESGGPGGHARERLDELIAQRLPVTEVEADEPSDADGEPEEECVDEPEEGLVDEELGSEPEDSGEGEPLTEGGGP